jgi:phosphatidylserine/phosphatidylglycerophosphate/cardiolipin synthase-like enzyme
MSKKPFSFYSKSEYLQELTKMILKCGSGDQISLSTMAFNPADTMITELINALCVAARHNANVHLNVDAFIFLNDDNMLPGPLFFHKDLPDQLPGKYKHKFDRLVQLRDAGGTFSIINRPSHRFSRPFAGRCHIKTAVINNSIFIGGCNLTNHQQLDIMVSFDNAKSARFLHKHLKNLGNALGSSSYMNGQDIKLAVSEECEILIDCGKPRQSIIFDQALKIIDDSREKLFFACQFFPNGTIARHLKMAHGRGVDVRVVYNDPSKHNFLRSIPLYLVLGVEKLKLPSELFRDELPEKSLFLHAKALVSENEALVGSHNLVPSGVKFGTSEIVLYVRNKSFANNLERSILEQL